MRRRLPDLREMRATAVIVLLAGLGVNLGALFLLNLPQAERLRRADDEIRAMQERLETRRREVGDLEAARSLIERQSSTVDMFLQDVLSGQSERMVAVQLEIREIARRHGISPDSIRYHDGPIEGAPDMVRFTASFPLVGSYQQLRAFIRDVEDSRNFLIIDAIDLTRGREGGVILSLVIRVSTIFRDPDYRSMRGSR